MNPILGPQPFALAARSVLLTSLRRYARSKGLWLLLLGGLVGARFWLPRDDGTSVIIAINNHLPELTSPMIGLSLGTVLSTLLLPICFLYLRSSVTRQQPWQIADVTPASRVAISLGGFFADSTVLFLLLSVMGLAGWLMAWFVLPVSQIHFWQIALALGLTGIPTVLGLAAFRRVAHAFLFTRRAFGDVLFFMFWFFSITAPLFAHSAVNTYRANLWDFGGSIQPLSHFANGLQSLSIGYGMAVLPGRARADVLAFLLSRPYLAARLTLAVGAIAVAAIAGMLYRPQTSRSRARISHRWTRWLQPGPAPAACLQVIPARASSFPFLNLIGSEMRLIVGSRLALLCGILVALVGFFTDYRHVASPLLFLLLLFGLTAQAAREETIGILALTVTAPFSPWRRRAAFVTGGLLASLLLSLPALLIHPSLRILGLATAIGFGAALFTIALTVLSRSAFAARLLLLLVWYGYISAH
jgi:hypothetical protein